MSANQLEIMTESRLNRDMLRTKDGLQEDWH